MSKVGESSKFSRYLQVITVTSCSNTAGLVPSRLTQTEEAKPSLFSHLLVINDTYEQHSDNCSVASHVLSYNTGVDRNQTMRRGQKYMIQTATDTGSAAPTSCSTKEEKPDTQTTALGW